jgi:predicted DNA-binding transcriptional regulator AlpA
MKSITQELEKFPVMPDDAYIRLPVLMQLLSVSRSTVLRSCENGTLPKPIKITERLNGWSVRAIREHLAAKAGV